MRSTIAVLLLASMFLATRSSAAPSSEEERTIEATARKVTRSVMIEHNGREKAFVFNTDLTTCTPDTPPSPETCAPPYANILTDAANFLQCTGGPFALCYYSGPEGTLPCEVRQDTEGNVADCKCIEVPYGPYFVDIHAIMDKQTYDETVDVCGLQGEKCTTPNSAPVCALINARKLIPGAGMISVFSFNCVPEEGIAQTSCGPGVYAGCMTAPCYRDDDDPAGIVRCECPLYEGCYEVGTPPPIGVCTLSKGNVWSSAHNQGVDCTDVTPPPCQDGTHPQRDHCIPDAPIGAQNACGQEVACPLYPDTEVGLTDAELTVLRASPECVDVCNEYKLCGAQAPDAATGLQHAYTCDAALCTSRCAADDTFEDDLVITGRACGQLSSCAASPGIQATLALEARIGCSCCASQICACDAPNAETEEAIYQLNVDQCARGITPQCCRNGTLCGRRNGQPFTCSDGKCPS